ncbi:MAG: CHRD domain-containing protein, partial [Thermoanaerobaculia bacterium]
METGAAGVGTFEYDGGTKELSYRIEFSGLSSAETMAHIHIGPPGEAGPPMTPLPAGSPKTGKVTLTPDQETALLAGNLYVNVHSADHPGGEIRGQIGPRTLSYTKLRVIPPELGGDPDHPIVRGLADDKGDIPVHDAAEIPFNVAYPSPGEGPAGVTGAGFRSVLETLTERGWGPGASETQFAGWPVTQGAVALASMVNPCNDQPLFQLNGGNLATEDGKGHIHMVAVEAGSERMVADPENCPVPCEFGGRTVFYWISDPMFPYSTPQALSLLRRSALWSRRLLESENRSDVPFKRGDANVDGTFDISDAVFALAFLFTGGDKPSCLDAV